MKFLFWFYSCMFQKQSETKRSNRKQFVYVYFLFLSTTHRRDVKIDVKYIHARAFTRVLGNLAICTAVEMTLPQRISRRDDISYVRAKGRTKDIKSLAFRSRR